MMIDMNSIVSQSDLQNDFDGVCEKVERKKELIVFKNNKPAYVFMTIDQYESIRGDEVSNSNEAEDLNEESLEVLLNKIGKKIFIDYYYVFKKDLNPEEELPENFTLNSRRSRSSSARKIFKNGWEIAALNNIVQSYRLDEDTLVNARAILEKEAGDISAVGLEFDTEDENVNEIKIGKSARKLISRFLQEGIITNEEIDLLQDNDYSKRVLNLNFAVLKEFDKNSSMDQQKKDQKGYNRYYDTVIPASGKQYLLCSQWVENLHKSSIEKWLEPKLMTILLDVVDKLQSGTEFSINELLSSYWPYVPYGTRKLLGRKFVEKVRNNTVSNVDELDKKNRNCQVYKKI
ncbi:MAG: DUF1413 domain-containing protein [Clostridiaceae bacterium]